MATSGKQTKSSRGRSGTRPWREIRAAAAERDPGFEQGVARERREIDREIAAYQRSLADVRRARAMTQITLAKALGVNQSQVSRIENEADLYLSTLQSYVEALGGDLELVGVFDQERVRLRLADVTGT